jgi:hypothetical protein
MFITASRLSILIPSASQASSVRYLNGLGTPAVTCRQNSSESPSQGDYPRLMRTSWALNSAILCIQPLRGNFLLLFSAAKSPACVFGSFGPYTGRYAAQRTSLHCLQSLQTSSEMYARRHVLPFHSLEKDLTGHKFCAPCFFLPLRPNNVSPWQIIAASWFRCSECFGAGEALGSRLFARCWYIEPTVTLLKWRNYAPNDVCT